MKALLLLVILMVSSLQAEKFNLKEWGPDVVKFDVYGIKFGMHDTHVRKVLTKREIKKLISDKDLRNPDSDYIEMEKAMEYDPIIHAKFLDRGYIDMTTNPPPLYTHFVRYSSDYSTEYPIKEGDSSLPYIDGAISYHEYNIVTNSGHYSLPVLTKKDKAKIKVFLNHDSRVIGIELVFKGIGREEESEFVSLLEDKYSKEIQKNPVVKDFFISKSIRLCNTFGKDFYSENGAKLNISQMKNAIEKHVEYTITNLYYHATKYVEAIKRKHVKEPELKDIL